MSIVKLRYGLIICSYICLQVVSALTHIVEGSTCSMVLRDCSPTRSESSYDKSESLKSDVSGELEDDEDGIICVGCNSINIKLPPSPPIGCTSLNSTSCISTRMSESPFDDLRNNEKKV